MVQFKVREQSSVRVWKESNLIYINARPTHNSPSPPKLPLVSRDDFPWVHTWVSWLQVFPPPTSTPAAAAHGSENPTTLTPICHRFPPPLSEAPAQRARPIPSRGMMVVPRRSAPTMRGKSQLQYFLILSLLSMLSVHFSHRFALSCTTYVLIYNSTHGCVNSSGLCHFCHRSFQSLILLLLYLKVLGRGSLPIYERLQVMEYCCETKCTAILFANKEVKKDQKGWKDNKGKRY